MVGQHLAIISSKGGNKKCHWYILNHSLQLLDLSTMTSNQSSQGVNLGLLVSDLGLLSLDQGPDVISDRRKIRFVGEDSIVDGRLSFFQSVHQLHIGCSSSIYLSRESSQAWELKENPLGLEEEAAPVAALASVSA